MKSLGQAAGTEMIKEKPGSSGKEINGVRSLIAAGNQKSKYL